MKTIIFTYEGTSQERKDNIKATLEKLNLTEDNVYVGGTNTVQNLLNILAKNRDSDILLLEDDVIPCNEFYHKISTVIKPKIINRLFTYSLRERGYNYLKDFYNMQCVYIPQNMIIPIISKGYWVLKYRQDIVARNDYEKVFQLLDGIFYTPDVNYVQTLDTDSTIFDVHTTESPLFVDNL